MRCRLGSKFEHGRQKYDGFLDFFIDDDVVELGMEILWLVSVGRNITIGQHTWHDHTIHKFDFMFVAGILQTILPLFVQMASAAMFTTT